MKNLFVLSIFLVFLAFNAFSQPWLYNTDKLKKGSWSVPFKIEQGLFNQYWKGRKHEKGKGYKQFKRIEYFVLPRTYSASTGGVINSKAYWESSQNLRTKLKSDNIYWQKLGPEEPPLSIIDNFPSGIGRVNCVAFHPLDEQTLFAGSPSGGLWKSSDGGNSWADVASNLLSLGITDIEIDFKDPNVIFISTGDGDAQHTYSLGILKSIDGGASFFPTSLSFDIQQNIHANSLCISRFDPKVMYVSTNIGIFKTSDGWETHEKVYSGNCKSVQLNPGNESVLVASIMSDEGKAMLLYSSDYGNSFSIAKNLSPWNVARVEIAYSASKPDIVYAVACNAEDYGFGGFFKSVNGGADWFLVKQFNSQKNILGWSSFGYDLGGQGWYDLAIAVDPADPNTVYVGGINTWKSSDGGVRWSCTSFWDTPFVDEYVHADIHCLAFDKNNNLYACSDGGVSISENNGKTWKSISDGINVAQLYDLEIRQGGKEFLCGTQDLGSHYFAGQTWNWMLDGDGMVCQFNPYAPDEMYVELYNGQIMRSYNRGLLFTNITPAEEYVDGVFQGAWVTPYILSHLEPSTLYAGFKQLYRSADKGDNWKVISSFNNDIPLTVVKQSFTNADIIVVSNGISSWITRTGGEVWSKITNIRVFEYITDISFATNDANEMWVSFSGYAEGLKVFYSDNGGESWTNYSDGLPNVPVNCVVMQKESDKLLYCGTDVGIFYRSAHMDSWQPLNNNLPPVIVTSIEIDYVDSELFLGTFGRGVWKGACVESPVYIDFDVSAFKVCADTAASVSYSFSGKGDFSDIEWSFGEGAVPNTAQGMGPHEVTYNTLTSVDVGISAIFGNMQYYEEKVDFVKTVDEYDISVFASSLYSCGDTVVFSVDQPGNIVWQSADSLLETIETEVAFPIKKTQYVYVEVSSGKCYDKDSILIAYNADNVCDAQDIFLGKNGVFSNSCATVEVGEPMPDTLGVSSCDKQMKWCAEGGLHNSVWFKLNVPPSKNIFIESPGFDNQIAVYEAENCAGILAGEYTLIAANDDFRSDDNSALVHPFEVEQGKEYWLQVDGSAGGAVGSFSVNVYDSLPLIPDFYASRHEIGVGESVDFFNQTIGDSDEYLWTFSGAIPENSADKNPSGIVYYVPGEYSVTLQVSRGDSKESITKMFYILVSGYELDCGELSNYDGEPVLTSYANGCGYIGGSNCYGDLAKAEKFSDVGKGKAISEVQIDFGAAYGDNSDIVVAVWNSVDGRPGNKIRTQNVHIDDIVNDVDERKTSIVRFYDPVLVGSDFFVGVLLPDNGDSVAIKTYNENSVNTAWEQYENGTWQPVNKQNAGYFSFDITVTLCLGAIELKDIDIFPNPCWDLLTINFKSIDPELYKFKIVDMSGKLVMAGNFEGRKSVQSIAIKELDQGVYSLNIFQGGKKYYIQFIKMGHP